MMGLFKTTYTTHLAVDPNNESRRPSDRSPEDYIGRIRFEEALDKTAAEKRRKEEELSRYDGLFGDLYFLDDVVRGLGKIGLEIPMDAQERFSRLEISRDELLASAEHIREQVRFA